MEGLQTLIVGLDYKIRKLLDIKRKLDDEVIDLKQENEKLKMIVEKQSEAIKQLEEELNIIKLGEFVNKRSDITEVKLKINELVHQIDKCIGLITVNK